MPRCCTAVLALWLAWLSPGNLRAHPAVLTEAEADMEADGRFRVAIRFDTLAFALNDTSARIGNEPMEALLAEPRGSLEVALADAKGRFLHGFKVVTERGPGKVEAIDFPAGSDVLHWQATVTPLLPVVLPVQLTGQLPLGAKSVTFQFPSVLTQVVLTEQLPGEDPVVEAVEEGKPSTPLTLVGDPSSSGQPKAQSTGRPPATLSERQKPEASKRGWNRRRIIEAVVGSFLLFALVWTGNRALAGKRFH